MRTFITLFTLTVVLSGFTATDTAACTVIKVEDTNGHVYRGRTMEFSTKIPTALTALPAGTTVTSATPSGATGKVFQTTYPVMAMTLQAVPDAKQVSVLDGMNDQGLSFSTNAFNHSKLAHPEVPAEDVLSVADLGLWILGSFSTVAEVKAALTSDRQSFWLPVTPVMGNVPYPGHHAVFDRSGSGIVIEFTDNNVNVYDNPVGVMTNGAEFPWHLTNLNNYPFTNLDRNVSQLGDLKIETDDAGIAMTPIPSSQTAAGRFVRAAFFANYVRKGSNSEEAILNLSHIMNNFDRPYDLTMDAAGGVGDGARSDKRSSEVTQWTVMHDTSNNRYYVRSINALNWTRVDFDTLQGVDEVTTLSTYDVDVPGADIFGGF